MPSETAGSRAAVRPFIREASGDDWPGIWRILAPIIDAGETYALPDGMSAEAARQVWMQAAPWRILVALIDDVIVGSAKLGPNRPGRGAHVATASFIVDPAMAGRGVGRALGEHVLAFARASGFTAMQFNAVVETNTAAVRLWQSLGFQILATVPEAFDHAEYGPVGLHIMHRTL